MKRWLGSIAWTLVAVTLLSPLAGCAGPLALIGAAVGLNQIPAEYPHLKDARVAVICVASSTSTNGSIDSTRLAEHVEHQLRSNVPNIRLVSQAEIEDWKDTNDWTQLDYKQIGRGLKADRVLAIDMKSYSLHSSQAFYQGTCELELTVYDMTKGGEIVYRKSPPVFQFPKVAVFSTTEKTEPDFRRMFVSYMSAEIARNFYAYDPEDAFASDLPYMSR